MFDYVLNTRLSLVVNKIWVMEDSMSLIRMKCQQKIQSYYITKKPLKLPRNSTALDYLGASDKVAKLSFSDLNEGFPKLA